MASISPFEEAHIEEALELWQATEHIGLSSTDEPTNLSAFLARNPGFSFVATEGGRVVGTCLCGHDGRRGYIYHLSVASSHRRQGLGAMLLDRCLAGLRGTGIQKCHAFVYYANPHGDLFWKAQGWERRDELIPYSKLTGA